MKKEIPNLLTLGNLLSGCLGLYASMQGSLIWASYAIAAALILDFLDGFVARWLGVSSELGKELDSLADVVSFGVLPSFMLIKLLEDACQGACYYGLAGFYKPWLSFLLALAAAYRLAKFNTDPRQSDQFIGVPTPSNGIVVASLPLILAHQPEWTPYVLNSQALLIYAILMSYLMVSELPLMAFKFKNFSWASNKLRYIFLLYAGILIIFLKFVGIPLLILSYILYSAGIHFTDQNKQA